MSQRYQTDENFVFRSGGAGDPCAVRKRRRSRVLRDNREAAAVMPRLMQQMTQHKVTAETPDQPDVAALLSKRPVQNSRHESVPAPDDRVPLDGAALHRLQFFLGASKMVHQDPEFMGLVMISLAAAVETDTWQRCVVAAVETLEAKR